MSTSAQAPQPTVQLIISVMPDGQIQVNGPVDNKMTCYALLECARDAIQAHAAQMAQQQRSGIIAARPVDPFLIRGRPNGHNPNGG